MRKAFLGVSTLLAAAAVAACGTSEGSSEKAREEEGRASPDEAASEIAAIEQMLERALAKYGRGDAGEAEELVGDAYLDHFERVEPQLEERDARLMAKLEDLLSTTIRDGMKRGEPEDEVGDLVAEAKNALDEAETLLSSG